MSKVKDGYVISVYKFMNLCGLCCEWDENIKVSHTIMMKKLELRHSKFPLQVTLPRRTSSDKVKKEQLSYGTVVLVKDDYGKVLPYYYCKTWNHLLMDIKKERDLKEISETENVSDDMEENFTPGYQKCLYRKNKKDLLKEQQEMLERKKESEKEILDVTEKIFRLSKTIHRKTKY